MRQARRVNTLRARGTATPRQSRRAGLLRAAIALLTLAIVVEIAVYLAGV
jgi:hypothetical protein